MRINWGLISVAFLAVFVALVENYLFFSDLIPLKKLALHILVINVCFAVTVFFAYLKWDLRFAIYLTILVASLGSFGAVVCLLTMLFYSIYLDTAESIKDFFAAIFPKTHFSKVELIYERITHGLDNYDPDYTPLPFMDVIEFGTEKQKRLAIEKILRYFRPEFAPSLLKALDDPSNGIRVLAATAVNTLDRHFFERYLELEKAVKNGKTTPSTLLRFANHCDLYAQSQILDEGRLRKVKKNAIDAYIGVLKYDSENVNVVANLSRLYVSEEMPELALELLEPRMTTLKTIPPEISRWYMAALYHLKDYEKLRKFTEDHFEITEDKSTPQDIKELILAWSGHG